MRSRPAICYRKPSLSIPDTPPRIPRWPKRGQLLVTTTKRKTRRNGRWSCLPKSSREERLLIQARSHEILAEQAAAVENYRALWQIFTDRVDYGLFLVRALINAGRGTEAKPTLAEVRKLSVSEADAARIDLADANVAASQSDFKQQVALAEKAANRGRAVGASLLVAEASQVEAVAAERMGQSDKAIQLAAQARDLYRQRATARERPAPCS